MTNTTEITNITEDDIYKIDIILEKSRINKEAFYFILKRLHITDRKAELRLLNYIVNLNKKELTEIAEAVYRLRV